MPLAHGPQRQDESKRPLGQPHLVGVRNDARVHDRRGAEGVFVAKIGADELALSAVQWISQANLARHLIVPFLEHPAYLAMAAFEIREHKGELGLGRAAVHGAHRGNDPPHSIIIDRVDVPRLRSEMKGPYDDPIWVRQQPQAGLDQRHAAPPEAAARALPLSEPSAALRIRAIARAAN